MKAAIIPADANEPIRFEEITADLGTYQEIVDGDIEHLGLRRYSMSMYLNENGKHERRPANHRATTLASWAQAVRVGDQIAGDVLIVGPIDGAGNDTGLRDVQQAWLERFDHEQSPAISLSATETRP